MKPEFGQYTNFDYWESPVVPVVHPALQGECKYCVLLSDGRGWICFEHLDDRNKIERVMQMADMEDSKSFS